MASESVLSQPTLVYMEPASLDRVCVSSTSGVKEVSGMLHIFMLESDLGGLMLTGEDDIGTDILWTEAGRPFRWWSMPTTYEEINLSCIM